MPEPIEDDTFPQALDNCKLIKKEEFEMNSSHDNLERLTRIMKLQSAPY